MAFSQSLDIGNSTFMSLENEANRAIKDENDRKQQQRGEGSGQKSGGTQLDSFRKAKSRVFPQGNKEVSRSRWRRSKSDTVTVAKHVPQATDNYSEFFKTDFSFSAEDKNCGADEKQNDEEFMQVSQIEAVFGISTPEDFEGIREEDEENADLEDVFTSLLDLPICSEDVKDIMETEEVDEMWKDSMPLSALPGGEAKVDAYPDLDCSAMLDATSFLCPAPNSEIARELKQESIREMVNDIETKERHESPAPAIEFEESPRMIGENGKEAEEQEQILDVDVQANVCEEQKSEAGARDEPPQTADKLESLKHISAWNLPRSVLNEYEKKGVVKMFPWQVECLSNPKVLFEHCNLVYSAPTSAGKTLVSEILLLKTVLERGKKVILILPFISVVREKMFYLQDLLTPAGYRVEGFFGGYTPPGGFESIHAAICTIEKANSIINKLLEQGKLDEIGTVVVDEVHLISDPGRGYILELLLAKVLYMSRKFAMQIQVITMSATLANVELLRQWLDAQLYSTDFRPVALKEMIKIGDKIYDSHMKLLRSVSEWPHSPDMVHLKNDADHVAQLCIETILEGCSAIVFCPSKDWCENLAVQLATGIHALGKSSPEWATRLRGFIKRDAIDEVKKQLKDIPTGLDSVMEKAITYGCAFHHAGLTTEERDIVEASFKSGALKIIVATSTLSSGVNLPARRVLIRSPLFGGKQMSSLTYKQMIGRAGRTGKDTLGESILICTENNARIGRDLVTADLKPISSCLELDSSTHLKRAILEVISSGVASSREDIESFVNCTLLSAQKRMGSSQAADSTQSGTDYIKDALDFLLEFEFIRLQTNAGDEQDIYVATRLGSACLASSMPPTDGLILFAELQKARRCFVLESELHAVYLVTPYSVCYQMQDLDWLLFLDLWEKLTPAMKKVGELVGVKESFLVRAMRGQTKLDYKLMQIHKRFYTALALQELVEEIPINQVAVKFKCTRGMLQSLQQMASTFAGIVTAFCNSLQWSTLALIVSQFKDRLYFGIHRDLIDLMRLPDLTQKRARCLFNAGITTLVELANSEAAAVEKILHNSLSFETAKQTDIENAYDTEKRNSERNFFITGKAGMTVGEAAHLLVNDARQYVQYEIGGGDIKWAQSGGEAKQEQSPEEDLHMSCEENRLHVDDGGKRKMEKLESPPKILRIESKAGEGVSVAELYDKPSTSKEAQRMVKALTSQKSVTKEQEAHQRLNEGKKIVTSVNKAKVNEAKKDAPIKVLERASVGYKQKTAGQISSKPSEEPPPRIFTSDIKKKETSRDTAPLQTNVSSKMDRKNSENVAGRKVDKENRVVASPLSVKTAPKTNDDTVPKVVNQTPRQPLRKSHENVPPTKKEKPSPKTSPIVKKVDPKAMPRRSPRNHLISSTRVETTPLRAPAKPQIAEKTETKKENDIQDLFMEDSFELNSGIVDMMSDGRAAVATNDGVLNKSPDEVPNSQSHQGPAVDSPVSVASATPQSSRFLRSYRSIRMAMTPKARPAEAKETVPKKSQNDTSKGSSIEISNLSLETSLLKNPMHLNASHILSCSKVEDSSSHFKCVEIIDICGDPKLFEGAFRELMDSKRFGFSIGVQQQETKRKPLIGGNLLINQVGTGKPPDVAVQFQIDDCNYIAGIAFGVGDNIVYYMNMQDEGSYKGLTGDVKVKHLRKLLKATENTLLVFDGKDQLKVLRRAVPDLGSILASLEDPKVANWLLQPDKALSFHHLTNQFAPECSALVNLCGSGRGYDSFGLDAQSNILAKVRCSIEACVTVHILKGQLENLERIGSGQLLKFFRELEMPLQLSLCNMEIAGFSASGDAMRKLFQQMVETSKKLELKIYELHGSRFNLSSTSAVAKVLGLHRKANGRVSTSRQILEKIDSPISQLIIAYRKLSVTLAKNIQPLLKCIENNRVHGQSVTYTSTGRISMTEPNLQNVAKDFEVEIGPEKVTISCRSAFFPLDPKRCLISSDFCQLEMRILAHLSQDPALLQVMNSSKDIFAAIAARWNKIGVDLVTEQLRNGTKQICYGIVYGMGMRSLAESLKCSEQEATLLSEQFHASYPGIRSYGNKVVKFARDNGYVETITGRRRYLDHINSGETQLKNQAERQAINSCIQGSAADIAKNAILRMEKNIGKYREKLGISETSVRLVLHLHDELIFEVPEDKAKKIAKVLSVTMENCVKLQVPLKVKLKIGKSWGDMKEIKF